VGLHNRLQRQKAEAEMARAALSRYFSPSVAAALSSSNEQLKPGGKRQEASFLFTDLAGFTPLVEATDPDVIVELLNGYLDGVAKVIFSHDGTVMKVIGDAVQAIFGAPVFQQDHCARAVACALDIDTFTEEFRAHWQGQGVPLGVTRIGINAGEAIIGNFGGDSFFDYTAYGDAVNTAARLESANKTLGTRICVSQSVVDQIENFHGRPAGHLQLAGKSGVLVSYEPMTEERANSPGIKAYREAFRLLEQGEPAARQSFAGLLGTMPDDPLSLFHLQRSLAGDTDVVIDARRK
jgi:adenylate cyclase